MSSQHSSFSSDTPQSKRLRSMLGDLASDSPAPLPLAPSPLYSRQSLDGLRASLEADKLSIELDRLKDENASLRDEMVRSQEIWTRHIATLEAQAKDLRRVLREEKDKFFEAKGAWLAKEREMEAALVKANRAFSQQTRPSTGDLPAPAATLGLMSKGLEASKVAEHLETIKYLEAELRAKAAVELEVQTRNAHLEKEVRCLQQQLQLAGVSKSEAREAGEFQSLRVRFEELEQNHRVKLRELARAEEKLVNQSLLQEEISQLQGKLKLVHSSAEELRDLEVRYHLLKMEKDQWSKLFKDIMSAAAADQTPTGQDSSATACTPVAVMRLMQDLQKKCSSLLQTQRDVSSTNWQLQQNIKELESVVATAKAGQAQMQPRIEELEMQLARSTKFSSLYKAEVDSLRKLLQSYDNELKIGRPDVSKVIDMKNEELAALRLSLDAARERAQEVAQSRSSVVDISTREVAAGGKKVEDSNSEHLRSEVSRLKVVVSDLQSYIEDLELFSGTDFVPGRVKVLHLSDNPYAMARRAALQSSKQKPQEGTSFDKLYSSENENTTIPIFRLQRLQDEAKSQKEGSSDSRAGNPELDQSVLSTSMVGSGVAGANNVDLNKLNIRMKEMFREQIRSYRDAVYMLTGYKVDLINNDRRQLRLKSMYAENSEDSLLFQFRDNGVDLDLLETPFAKRISPQQFEYLNSCNSIPAFLSAVTLELFDNTTFMGNPGL